MYANARPVTQEEVRMLNALKKVTPSSGTPHRRFIQQADFHIENGITERQGQYLRFLFYRYRRQHGLKAEKFEWPPVEVVVKEKVVKVRQDKNTLKDLDSLTRWNENVDDWDELG